MTKISLFSPKNAYRHQPPETKVARAKNQQQKATYSLFMAINPLELAQSDAILLLFAQCSLGHTLTLDLSQPSEQWLLGLHLQ